MMNQSPSTMTASATSQEEDDEEVDRAFYTLGESEEAAFHFPDDKAPPKPPAKSRSGTGLGRDQDEWETALLVRSGAAREGGGREDDDDSGRAQIIVRASRPSFVKDTVGLVKAELVDVVKDRTCDLAKAAERGSPTVRLWREKTAKGKMRHRYWELGGSAIGKAIGDKTEADFGQKQEEDPSVRVAEALQDQMPAQADQEKVNQALPITRVLPELLKCVREHQIVVVVGETGSGKTTRLPIALWQDRIGAGLVACTQPRRVAAM
jgi:pre-mRNA-splicing factor ATP-dependent RNA helicase DHX38/PRP16